MAWSQLHGHGYQPVSAHQTILRTAIETSATARWVLNGSTTNERIGRAAAVRENDLRRRAQFEAAICASSTAFSGTELPAASSLALHRRAMKAANMATRIPSMTDLVRDHASNRPLSRGRTPGSIFFSQQPEFLQQMGA